MAALWARIRTKIDAAVPSSDGTSDHATSGSPMEGRPPDTGPMVLTPSSARSSHHEKKIAPITAISAPGTLVVTNRAPRITTMTAADTATVVQLTSPRFPRVDTNLATVLSKSIAADRDPGALGHAEQRADLPGRDLDADTGQEADEHRAGQEVGQEAESDHPGEQEEPAAMSASSPASATYWSEPVAARPASPAAMTAAVAESAPTTRCARRTEDGEDQNRQQIV